MADIELNDNVQAKSAAGPLSPARCPKCRGVLKCSNFPDLYYTCQNCGHVLWIIPPKDKKN